MVFHCVGRVKAARLALLLSAMTLLLAYNARLCAQPVWDITEHGAKPGRDVTAIIQEGLTTQPTHGLPVYIPSGRWGITSTLELPKRDGGALIGVGAGSNGAVANNALRGLTSVIEWFGEADQPVLRMTGSRWRVENLSIRGAPAKSERPKAAIGILITKTGDGIGPGKHEFRNVTIAACEVGIQCGLEAAEHNNDALGFERLIIDDCDVGYRAVNSQAMSHWIDRLEIRNTPVGFQFFGGGMLHARNIFAVDTTLIELKQNNPRNLSTGVNNEVFRVENLKVDTQHFGKFCLVTSDYNSNAQIVLDCGMVSGPSPFTLARLRGRMQLVLRDVTSPTSQATVEQGGFATVLIDNVRMKGLEHLDSKAIETGQP